MKTSQRGIDLIKGFETLRTTAYQDTGGVWTIGYGHTHDVKEGQTLTPGEAEKLLADDLVVAEAAVNKFKVPLKQREFDALVSLCFNIGTAAFTSSTLFKKLNSRHYIAACAEMIKWRYDNGLELLGLARRRVAEMKLFLGE